MIFIVTGATHCGKTLFAQRLSEKLKVPYYSIDHIKMGLIRSNLTSLTPENDRELTPFLWKIVSEMIKTAIENRQNAIFEGCYIPFDSRKDFEEEYLKEIKFVCLAFSDAYIDKNMGLIHAHANDIEKRLDDSDCTAEYLKAENHFFIQGFSNAGEKVCIINENYTHTVNGIIRELTGCPHWVIQTPRLFLRELNEGDFEALYRVLADSDIMQHYPYTFDGARVKNWISKNIARYNDFGFGLWAVCLKDTGEMIGDCGVTMQNINGEIKPEIGYHIRKDKQRLGYAKEAAAAVRDWVFENTPFNQVHSYMKSTNIPSISTAISYGCKKSGEYQDSENGITAVYSLSREEWDKIKQKD